MNLVARQRLRRLWAPLRSALKSPRSPARALALHDELGYLERVEKVDASRPASTPGVVMQLSEASQMAEDLVKQSMAGRTGGDVEPPGWHDGSGGLPIAGVHLSRVGDVFYAPEFGAVISARGEVFRSPVAEALYLTPSLAALPFVELVDGAPMFQPPARLERLPRAAIFVAWGGRFNYGHFLLDCLPALMALKQQGLLDDFPILAPPLTTWQRQLLHLLLGPAAAQVREIGKPLVQVEDLAFASPMNHFLHTPAPPLDAVREAILSRTPPSADPSPRLYLSRRRDTKRRMVNEEALEAALVSRGFRVIFPEDHDAAQQVALFRDAEVIVAPTGAALANVLFCKPDAKVFEIQPINYTGIWVRGVCTMVGTPWHGFFVASPLSEVEVEIEGVRRPGAQFEWRMPVEAFTDFLDARIQ